VADKVKGLFIPLVILMFQKKDGGISVVAKNVPQSERFFDNHYKKE
jgi:3-hydroxymyristoyl/3-hydroxydecanoyl-(acyl carrier protein) dehydratase